MRNGIGKKIATAFICSLLFISCSKKPPTIGEELASKDPAVIRTALSEIWRTGDSNYTVDCVKLLDDSSLRINAAYALSYLCSPAVDSVVMNRITPAKDKCGHIFYLYLASKKRMLGHEVFQYLGTNAEKFSPCEKFLAYMVIQRSESRLFKKVVETFGPAKSGLPKEVLVEFALLMGEKNRPETGKILDDFRSDPYVKAAASWAEHKTRQNGAIGYNFKDRIIGENPFWEKYGKNPVMPAVPGSYKSIHTANPDTLVNSSTVYCYYRGGDGHDRICLATIPMQFFDGVHFNDYARNPVIGLGFKGSFDDSAALDPSAVYFNKKVFLYYSGLGTGDNSIGLAVSGNFYDFSKYFRNPVLKGRAPDAVLKDGILYLYYVLSNYRGGYSVFLATSNDGYNFIKYGADPVFDYAANKRDWDGKSVTTPRIIEKNGVYYMLYCGDNKYIDYPAFFGLAFSYDLINWHRGTRNPIFSRGKKGGFDDGAIWYGQILAHKGKLYLWYEGWGGGESHEKEYGAGGRSQIGLAVSGYNIEDML
jgi:predicted GH43/DUF377 family glycosyl hydrolase